MNEFSNIVKYIVDINCEIFDIRSGDVLKMAIAR
jgi:hypothetical protein